MNYRLIFVSLFVLSFNYVLINSVPKDKKDWEKTSRVNHEVQLFGLEFAENQDEQQFRKKLKKNNFYMPSSSTLASIAKCFKEEVDCENLSQGELVKKTRAACFFEMLAKKQGRSWLQKAREDHPYYYTLAGSGAVTFAACSLFREMLKSMEKSYSFGMKKSILRCMLDTLAGDILAKRTLNDLAGF